MDLPISSIPSSFSDGLARVAASSYGFIPDELRHAIRHASSYIPVEVDMASSAMFMLYFAASALILGVLGRVVLGKRSSLNHSLSSVMGILCIYALTIVIYTFKPWNLEALVSPLPFVTFSGDYLIIFPIADSRFPALCSQVLSLIVLSFVVNLLDTVFPQGKTPIGWYLLRFVCVIAAMLFHLLVQWVIRTYLPEFFAAYAPTALLIILAIMLLSGLISLVLGLVVAVANPFLGAMYSFFFSNIIGKQVSKAVFTSGILCVVFYLLEFFGYTVICITTAALASYIPLLVLLLLLWYLIGHVL